MPQELHELFFPPQPRVFYDPTFSGLTHHVSRVRKAIRTELFEYLSNKRAANNSKQ